MYVLCITLIPNFWLFGLNDKRIKPIEVDGLLEGSRRNPGSVSLVWWKQCCIHWLHAGWTGKGSHQPVIYTVQVVDVHARQKSNRVPIHKVHHTNDASGETRNRVMVTHWKWKAMQYLSDTTISNKILLLLTDMARFLCYISAGSTQHWISWCFLHTISPWLQH